MLDEIREYLSAKIPLDETIGFSGTEKLLFRLGV